MQPAYLHRLTLRQIEIFLAVCQYRSFSKAAERLSVTQPAVSIQMRTLEELAQQPLFDFIGKKLYLTAAGEVLERVARQIQQQLLGLEMELSQLQGRLEGPLHLAMESAAVELLPARLAEFTRLHPRVELVLTIQNHHTLLQRLADNRDDLVVMTQVPRDLPLIFAPFAEHRLLALAHRQHPLAAPRNEPVRLLEFLEAGVLVRESDSGTRRSLERFCQQQSCVLAPGPQLGSNEAIKQGLLAEMGVAVLPERSVVRELAEGVLVALPVQGFPLRHSWCLVRPQDKHLAPVAAAFWQFITGSVQSVG